MFSKYHRNLNNAALKGLSLVTVSRTNLVGIISASFEAQRRLRLSSLPTPNQRESERERQGALERELERERERERAPNNE